MGGKNWPAFLPEREDDDSSSKRKASPDPSSNSARKRNPRTASLVEFKSDFAQSHLLLLPTEIVDQIFREIDDVATVGNLGLTCKRFYPLAVPIIHSRLTISWSHFSEYRLMMRTMAPHLTATQKKDLREASGKDYRLQIDRFNIGKYTDSGCADYVRQMAIGCIETEFGHGPILFRYLEQALINMRNLEMIDISAMTEPMVESITSLKNLKAVRLTNNISPPCMRRLAKIKGLHHFSAEVVRNVQDLAAFYKMILEIMSNSRTTLKSLSVKVDRFGPSFIRRWSEQLLPNDHWHDLPALRAFEISGFTFEAESINCLRKAIDFLNLRELTIGRLLQGLRFFFLFLTDLLASSPSKDISLRSLTMVMTEDASNVQQRQVGTATRFRLISSFDTLTTLHLADYHEDVGQNGIGAPKLLLEAILKHKNLEILRMTYNGTISHDRRVPKLAEPTVAAIVDGLPKLQQFDFAPNAAYMDKIAKVFTRAKNLIRVTCYPHINVPNTTGFIGIGPIILYDILDAFMCRDRSILNLNKFPTVWEGYCKLESLAAHGVIWDIGPFVKQPSKGIKAAIKVVDSHNHDVVWYRDITQSDSRYSGTFDNTGEDYDWLDSVPEHMGWS